VLAATVVRLLQADVARDITREALLVLRDQFTDPRAAGSQMAARSRHADVGKTKSRSRVRSLLTLCKPSNEAESVICGDSDRAALRVLPAACATVERWLEALALEIVDRVLEQHAVLVEEPVEVEPGREIQQVAELMCSNPIGWLRVDRERLERDFDRSRSWVLGPVACVLPHRSQGAYWRLLR
jgi:hypothetical protein